MHVKGRNGHRRDVLGLWRSVSVAGLTVSHRRRRVGRRSLRNTMKRSRPRSQRPQSRPGRRPTSKSSKSHNQCAGATTHRRTRSCGGVLVIKEGTVESLVNGQLQRVGPGSIVFQASNQMHTIRNVGDTPATYHVIQWNSPGMLKKQPDVLR